MCGRIKKIKKEDGKMYFSLCNTSITLDILAAIFFVCYLKLRLQSSVSPRKLKSFTFSVGDPFMFRCSLGVYHFFDNIVNCIFYWHIP